MIRLQKYLSEQQICSRRVAEDWIQRGWVQINGEPAVLGDKVDPNVDTITLAEDANQARQTTTTIAFHKPRGIMTNCPQKGDQEIRDLLPKSLEGLSSIGRLDKDSEGLILMTDDGVLANKLLNRGEHHEREYIVWLNKSISESMIEALRDGVMVLGQKTKRCVVERQKPKQVRMVLTEGKNRQIRRMMRVLGLTVVRLKRIRFGSIHLGDLTPGSYRKIDPKKL